jgi:O-6-methylguanine DNA methyltransferase
MTNNNSKYYTSFTISGIHFTVISSPKGINEIIFNSRSAQVKIKDAVYLQPDDSKLHGIFNQLCEYFKGERKVFNLPVEIEGTDFQKRVWRELEKIPYGKTISYKELALRLGDEKVIRAAAGANGANPLSIIIPCHRVIGSDGSLIGYGGGLEIKAKLLELEGNREPDLFNSPE